jgi:hypothetical protein
MTESAFGAVIINEVCSVYCASDPYGRKPLGSTSGGRSGDHITQEMTFMESFTTAIAAPAKSNPKSMAKVTNPIHPRTLL